MHSLSRLRLFCFATAAFIACASPAAYGQAFYIVQKAQVYTQTSSTGSVPDPQTPAAFAAGAAIGVTLTLPSGATQTLTSSGGGGDNAFDLEVGFASKAALDAAYPN